MVDKSSLNFLPKTFQTNTNRRFLNATVDQLIQEPNLGRVYGYIGRQDLSPAYRTGDAYVQEVDTYSQFYQLEPGLVINKRVANTQTIKKQNAYNYVDLLKGHAQSDCAIKAPAQHDARANQRAQNEAHRADRKSNAEHDFGQAVDALQHEG